MELRWLKLEGQVDIRGRGLSAGAGMEEDREDVEAAGAGVNSLLSAPQLPDLGVSAKLEFTPGVRFRFTLRCKLMLKSSPVAEGRFPKLIEFLVAFFPVLLKLTLAEFPSRDLQGVTLPPRGVLRLSKAERDWVDPWLFPGVQKTLKGAEPNELRSVVDAVMRVWYCRASLLIYCSNWVKEMEFGCIGTDWEVSLVGWGVSSVWGASGMGAARASSSWVVKRGL